MSAVNRSGGPFLGVGGQVTQSLRMYVNVALRKTRRNKKDHPRAEREEREECVL